MKHLIFLSTVMFCLIVSSAYVDADRPTVDDRWVKLGSRKVNYGLDKDVIRVGAKEAGFRKLKIEVTGGKLNMHRMVVEYMNGTKDNIPLKHNFSRASASRVIDLEGGKRLIKDITFWYDTKNLARKRAKVIVWGRR